MGGPNQWTEEIVQRRMEEGRGQGEREDDFTPWQYVQEFSSRGTQSRVPPLLLTRTVHTFSYIERALFLFVEFWLRPWLYREQFAMDRGITMGAAAALGIQYPRYPVTRAFVVMTLDAVVSYSDTAGRPIVAAYDCKPARFLAHKRTLEKLALHKAYCAHRHWPHYLITERSIPRQFVRNLDWLRSGPERPGEIEVVPGMFTTMPQLMLEDLFSRRPAASIRDYCKAFDHKHRLPRGTGLRLLKVLIWRRDLVVDLNQPALTLTAVPVPTRPQAHVAQRRAA
jgi:TnsA endonuclease N terminal/TnsA endonuclease C terminal